MSTSRKIAIEVDAELRVSGLIDAADDARFALVLAHGAGAGMTHAFMEAVARGLAERRIACLRYQFPYMERGSKRPDAPPLAHAAVRAAVASAAAHFQGLPLFAGGKSFGGRMTSQAQALGLLPGVAGLVFLGFPLHAAGKPSIDRAAHLHEVDVPMLFVHGAQDKLAEPLCFAQVVDSLGDWASVDEYAAADHGFHVPKKSGLTDELVIEQLLDRIAVWMQAWLLP